MKKILGLAGAIALSIIPTPSFSGEVTSDRSTKVTGGGVGEGFWSSGLLLTTSDY